ncbi:MAG: LamG domain-containing protein, partial [Thermoguttaceae bacterium]|nr:LamG domain-containing protein [Thermoguttaceae bacterium]
SIKQLLRVSLGTAVLATAMSATWANAALVGYWKLNETSGNIASDASGIGRNGTLYGALTGPPPNPGPAWIPDGVFDGVISLDGLNDRIHVTDHPDLRYAGGNMTLSTWIYLDAAENVGRFISKPWNGSGRYNYGLIVEGTNTRITFSMANAYTAPPEGEPDKRQSVSLSSPSYPSFRETWHHVAAVADSANNMWLYVDGELVNSRTNTITDWGGSIQTIPLTLGTLYPYSAASWAGDTGHAFHGKMDDVAIWNDALDPAKVMSIYNVPTTLGLSYDLGDMMTLWAAYDAGPGGAGAVHRTPWQYTDELPGSPPAPGGAYTHGDAMYIVLGSGDGLRSPAVTNWVGGGADGHWSTAANWSPATNDPYGYHLHFDNGVPVDFTKLSGTVDDSYTVASMTFSNQSAGTDPTPDPNGSRLYTLNVPDGATLTVSGAVNVGYQFTSWVVNDRNRYPVTAQFTGGGEMVINGPVLIQNSGQGAPKEAATLDISGLSKFTIDTTGDIVLGGRNDGRGVLILSPDNLLRATNILAPGAANHSSSPLLGGVLALGQKNTIHADTISIGGMGLSADMLFQEDLVSPEVTIRNYSGDGPANLYVGHTRGNIRTHTGTVDFSGGTVDAQLDELQIGVFDVETTTGSSRTATGILVISAGTISADDVIVGRNVVGNDNGTNATYSAYGTLDIRGGDFSATTITLGQYSGAPNDFARGTIDLSGGTLTVATVEKGDGEAVFDFTGGTLQVDAFGSAAKPFTLDQLGGTLAPGNSIGTTTIYGDYHQAAGGILQIEIAGTETAGTDFDFVEVVGNTLLEGWLEVLLIPDFTAKPGDVFDVLHTSGTLDIAGDLSTRLIGDLPSPTFGWWEVATVLGAGGEGMTLRLAAVPEPSALLLVAFGLISLVLAGGRRSGKRA